MNESLEIISVLEAVGVLVVAGFLTFVANKMIDKSAKKYVENIEKLRILAKESSSEEEFDLSDITESEKLNSRYFVTEFALAVKRKHEAICLLNPKYDCRICDFVDNMLDRDICSLISYCKDNYPAHVYRHVKSAYTEFKMCRNVVDSKSIQNLWCGGEALEYFLESAILVHLEENGEVDEYTRDELKRFVKLAVNYFN